MAAHDSTALLERAYHMNRKPWTAEEISLLGTMSDTDLESVINRSRTCIHACRNAIGVDAFGYHTWSKSEL